MSEAKNRMDIRRTEQQGALRVFERTKLAEAHAEADFLRAKAEVVVAEATLAIANSEMLAALNEYHAEFSAKMEAKDNSATSNLNAANPDAVTIAKAHQPEQHLTTDYTIAAGTDLQEELKGYTGSDPETWESSAKVMATAPLGDGSCLPHNAGDEAEREALAGNPNVEIDGYAPVVDATEAKFITPPGDDSETASERQTEDA